MNNAIISVIGMAGSGKSTLSKSLAERFSFTHMVTGDAVRRMAEQDPEVKAALDKGEFAPREKMNRFMMQWLSDEADRNTIVLDGYPRYKEQFFDMVGMGIAMKLPVYLLYVTCDDSTARHRLLKRKRADDHEDAINKRIENFWKETYEVVSLAEICLQNKVKTLYMGTPEETLKQAIEYTHQRILNAAR
jgi:adenylate kinase family enzyme